MYCVISNRPGAKPSDPLPKAAANQLAKMMHKLTGQEYKVVGANEVNQAAPEGDISDGKELE